MIKRQLAFYRWNSIDSQAEFVPEATFGVLQDKTAGDPEFAVMKHEEITTAVTVMNAGSTTEPSELQLLALRSADNRPSQWRPGERLGPLPLQDDQYPADVTHVMMWPDGIAAQDMHPNAPRLGRLSFYLRQMINAYVSFTPLYRPDMLDRLRRLRGQLRGIEVSLTHPEYLADDRGAFGTLLPAAFGQRAPSVGVRIGMGRRGPRDRFLDGATEEAVFQIAEDAHDQVDRLIVFGRDPATGQTERVNLLSERVEVRLELAVRPDVPALPVEEDVFRELASAYRSFKLDGLFDRAIEAQSRRSR